MKNQATGIQMHPIIPEKKIMKKTIDLNNIISKLPFQLTLPLLYFTFYSSILIQISDHWNNNFSTIIFFRFAVSSNGYSLSSLYLTKIHIKSSFLSTVVSIFDFLSIPSNILNLKTNDTVTAIRI